MSKNVGFEVHDSNEQTIILKPVMNFRGSRKERERREKSMPMLEIHYMSMEEFEKLQEVQSQIQKEMRLHKSKTYYERILEEIKKHI